jgi:hypothetical protein
MFLHFHRKYNMILFVLEIFDYIQIKTLFFFFDFFLTFTKNTHTFFFYYVFLLHSHLHVTNHQNST